MSYNKVTVVGNLGRDAELRHTQGGASVLNFSVAATEKWRDKTTNQQKEHTEWVRCVCWGRQADTLAEYLVKGKQVLVDGRLRTRSWDDRNGEKKYMTEVHADRIVLLGGRRDGDGGGGVRQASRRAEERVYQQREDVEEQPVAAGTATDDEFNDEVPF